MTAGELQTLCLQRVGEDPDSPQYYLASEALAALNMAQRLFVFLTLCLEQTATLTIPANTAFYAVTPILFDFLLPLRVRTTTKKLRAARLTDLAALDATWPIQTNTVPERYAMVGYNLLVLYPAPADAIALPITYARCPLEMAGEWAVPEIPLEYHGCLVDGAIPLMRTKEGAQEWQKTLPLWNRFLDEVQRMGDAVRARSKEQGYDNMPFELANFDRSRLVKL